jgi:hypothetical protein
MKFNISDIINKNRSDKKISHKVKTTTRLLKVREN